MHIDILDAGHGDCLLVNCGNKLILIDSGPKALKIRKTLVPLLKALLGGRAIDLAIVTHNDDDHIGCYKYIIDSGVIINEFIFNSLSLVGEIFRQTKRTNKISFRQDMELQKLIDAEGIKVRTFQREDSIYCLDDITLVALTPDELILKKLDKKASSQKEQNKISRIGRTEPSVFECINIINNDEDVFVEDSSITNKSSISFVLEYENKRVLFLGDSHPSDVIYALNELPSTSRNFDLVKLSHHASQKNTSLELLELLGDTQYIICADKSHHGHPNNITIGRILNFNSSAKFHMSSDNEDLRSIFTECTKLGYPVTVTYPKNGVNRVAP